MFKAPSTSNNAAQELRELPVELVVPNPSQPRRHFDEATLKELAGSIGERGVLQPVLVRPLRDGKYGLVAGERRWRAAKLAGLQTIPALVSGYDDLAALETGLIENMAREDLNPVEKARACATLVNELGLSLDQVAQGLGRSTGTVSNLMRLLKLSDEILELLERGQLSEGHGRTLLRARDPESHRELAGKAVKEGWSVRELEAHADRCNDAAGAPKATRKAHNHYQQEAALNVARAWGDLLGAEVHVRAMRKEQMRLEVEFDFAAEGLALAERLTGVVAGGSTGS
jgi:ParB family chromosome partitioning protein